jgi:hypothetical protein
MLLYPYVITAIFCNIYIYIYTRPKHNILLDMLCRLQTAVCQYLLKLYNRDLEFSTVDSIVK